MMLFSVRPLTLSSPVTQSLSGHKQPLSIMLCLAHRLLATLIITATLCGFNATALAKLPLPKALTAIEGEAEDIIDSVPGGNWKKISGVVAEVAGHWAKYQQQATKDGLPAAQQEAFAGALTKLQASATAKHPANTMQAANDLSAVVMDLFDAYECRVPTDIGRLDVLERQVVLDVAAKNFVAVEASLNKTQILWTQVKPAVLAHKGAKVAARFEANLAAQTKALAAKNSAQLTAAAKQGLETVDDLEKLF